MNKKKILTIAITALVSVAASFSAFAAEKTVTAEIPVTIKNGGTAIIEKDCEGPDAQQPKLVIPADKQTDIFRITFTEPDDYRYKIRQENGTDENTVYDETVYTVMLKVLTEDDGSLSYITVFSDGSSVKPSSVSFENTSKNNNENPTRPSDHINGSYSGSHSSGPRMPEKLIESPKEPEREVAGVDKPNDNIPDSGQSDVEGRSREQAKGVNGVGRSPKTGDDAPFLALSAVAIVSLFGFATTLIGYKKRKKEQK